MIRGTAVKITTAITADDAVSSVTITITDPDGTAVVEDAAMTLVSGTTYKYVFQSSTSGTAGRYTAVITAVAGSYTAMAPQVFTLD